jgi:hypothetical protein
MMPRKGDEFSVITLFFIGDAKNLVITGQKRVFAADVPVIHVLLRLSDKRTWMAGTSSPKTRFCPAMTECG